MPRYRYVGDTPRTVPALGLELEPGGEFDSDQEINVEEGSLFQLVQQKGAKAKPAVAVPADDSLAPAQEG